MPELPEVETLRRQLEPQIKNQLISKVVVRQSALRWPIPRNLARKLRGQIVRSVRRRGKYLLLGIDNGSLIIHLGMSGSLLVLPKNHPIKKHDHVDIIFSNNYCLRFNDPRRFGAILWSRDPLKHKLLANLGPEPLTTNFNGEYLYNYSRHRKVAIKPFIMDNHIVTGIGNVYANEALFCAGINPRCKTGKIPKRRYTSLSKCIKKILYAAIKKNGTTFRDFISSNGEPGQFAPRLKVYGRGGMPCTKCGTKLREIKLRQRSTVYCPKCQDFSNCNASSTSG
ncbi:MAG: 5-hydroxymethyluracil DNA glycosylase [Coxiella sp. DG_40]|nr:MAG: 5-hydroxymethyluracil DNA glycosylase [Coxiella sp. DG_40]